MLVVAVAVCKAVVVVVVKEVDSPRTEVAALFNHAVERVAM